MEEINLMSSWVGITALVIFVVGYLIIALEEQVHINKAKPALFMGTFIFILIGVYYFGTGAPPEKLEDLHEAINHIVIEIAGIFFFLFVAMTYIEALIERDVFEKLKHNLMQKGYDYKKLFWATGTLSFFISPVADNLTTALILSTVLITLEKDNKKFLVLGAINIVVAANAGGAWSPFGDITTLMVWASGKGAFAEFLFLFPASVLGWGVTAFLLSKMLPEGSPKSHGDEKAVEIKPGGHMIIVLGVLTIATAVISHQLFHIPAFWGMMFGLSLLKLYSAYLKKRHNVEIMIFESIAKIENDTLLFFFGLLGAVGGLSYIGYLGYAAGVYDVIDHATVNVMVGLISAVVDNVPVMYAVLKANPDMTQAQWMLVTLTAGIGGSLISFGSAAGVGVMGKIRGVYTFGSHMKYAWAVAAGYIVSIAIWYVQFEVLHFHLGH